MKNLAKLTKECVGTFHSDESGAAFTEYALLIGLIAIAVFLVVQTLGTKIKDIFQDIVDKLGSIL
jgi:Flp pilus assembly pilin Flp